MIRDFMIGMDRDYFMNSPQNFSMFGVGWSQNQPTQDGRMLLYYFRPNSGWATMALIAARREWSRAAEAWYTASIGAIDHGGIAAEAVTDEFPDDALQNSFLVIHPEFGRK